MTISNSTVRHLSSDTTNSRLVNTLSDKDFEKNTKVHLVGFLNIISKSKVELAQYSRLTNISMQKVKIPQENAMGYGEILWNKKCFRRIFSV
jgi:hypothetical protein